VNDPWSVPPTGGETYREIVARVGAALATFVRPCVVVAHAGTGRAVLHIEGGVEAHEATQTPMLQGRVLIVENGSFAWR
jgi:broad specificity phosphatase PhoE